MSLGSGGNSNAGRKPGGPKTGGRQKGTPNTDRAALLARAKELGLEPWDALVTIAKDSLIEPTIKFQAIKEVCSYVYTKTKAVELSGANGEPLTPLKPLSLEETIALVKAAREVK